MATAFVEVKRRKRGPLTSPRDVDEGSSGSSEDSRTEPFMVQEARSGSPRWKLSDRRDDASKNEGITLHRSPKSKVD